MKRKSWVSNLRKSLVTQPMNENNCWKFLRHYSDVLADVPEEISSKYVLFCLLEASKDLLFRQTCFEVLYEENISYCSIFEELMIGFLALFLDEKPIPNITFSLSMLQKFVKKWLSIGMFSEQAIERLHAIINKITKK